MNPCRLSEAFHKGTKAKLTYLRQVLRMIGRRSGRNDFPLLWYAAMLFLVACLGCRSAVAPETAATSGLPPGFVVVDLRYFGSHNFVGARVDGYEAPRAILTRRAAEALAEIESEMQVKLYEAVH